MMGCPSYREKLRYMIFLSNVNAFFSRSCSSTLSHFIEPAFLSYFDLLYIMINVCTRSFNLFKIKLKEFGEVVCVNFIQ